MRNAKIAASLADHPQARLLIVKTSSMGDIVHSFPMVTDIRREIPGLEIDWVAEEAFQSIPTLHPAVSSVFPVAFRRWRRDPFRRAFQREAADFFRSLRARRYDVVLDNQGLLKSALIASMARGPVWGADFASAREAVSAIFYRRTASVAFEQHAIVRNRQLAARLFGYEARIADTPIDYGLTTGPVDLKPFALCLHATSRMSKLWPESSWKTLVRSVADLGLQPLLPFGSECSEDERRASRIAASEPRSRIIAPLTLAHLTAMLRDAALVIGVDTGLVHLAAALGRPTVALYVDTDPERYGVMSSSGRIMNIGQAGRPPSAEEAAAAVRWVLAP